MKIFSWKTVGLFFFSMLANANGIPSVDCNEIFSLRTNYTDEEIGLSRQLPGVAVRYLGLEEREQYLVSVEDGLLMIKNPDDPSQNFPLTTPGAKQAQDAMFVWSLDEQIYSGLAHMDDDTHHHSSFTGGSDLLSAGNFVVIEGVLREANNGSGHYKPNWQSMLRFLKWLQSRGVSLERVKIFLYYIHPTINPEVQTRYQEELGILPTQLMMFRGYPSSSWNHFTQGTGSFIGH